MEKTESLETAIVFSCKHPTGVAEKGSTFCCHLANVSEIAVIK